MHYPNAGFFCVHFDSAYRPNTEKKSSGYSAEVTYEFLLGYCSYTYAVISIDLHQNGETKIMQSQKFPMLFSNFVVCQLYKMHE